ncbi:MULTISPECIES: hypothetical protein [Bacillus cereus group]|uniref:hypothetical protein n=1 Tax=Bacillus cereus group TaxID=86661 RepID=UPI0022E2E0A9|nr:MULTISPECIES: hypothetical protein [unclassified Bacillus cereus group]MDA2026734.1 hypothetical protein [Bacillus cereus group sp. Bcc03]MDA2713433.1 hypothetical protein [Bacillus cereus group sp. Bc025]HDR7716910.1 hypothetical protein [Bacillus albus]
MEVVMKNYKVIFYFDDENTRSLIVEAANSKEVIQDIEAKKWFGNDDVRVNLDNVTHYKIKQVR